MTTFVSIIIPHLDDLPGLARCMVALEGQNFGRDRFEILVVDNGSACGSAAVLNCIGGRARLLIEQQPGAGPARNRGASEARGDVLAFTDADCLPRPDWLQRGTALVTTRNFVGGGIVVTAADPARPSAAEAYELAFAFDMARYAYKKRFVATANLFMSRATFLAVGQFDDTLSEDTDWCWRAIRDGYQLVFDATTIVEHPARRTFGAVAAKQTRITRERFHLAMRWGMSRRACASRAVAALLVLPGEMVRIRRVPFRYWAPVLGMLLLLRWRRCIETLKLCRII